MYIPYIYITHSLSYTGGFFVNQWNVQIINIAPIAYVCPSHKPMRNVLEI